MALQIVWTPDSSQQLNDILSYWVQRNETSTYALKLYKFVKIALKILAKYPQTGKLTERPNIRVKIIKDYYLFYTYDNKRLFVLGLCDMRRDPTFIETFLE